MSNNEGTDPPTVPVPSQAMEIADDEGDIITIPLEPSDDRKQVEDQRDEPKHNTLSEQLYSLLVDTEPPSELLAGQVKRLLEEGADNSFQDQNQQTAFHWACANGHLKEARLLLETFGTEVIHPFGKQGDSSQEATPFLRACMSSQTAVVEWLLTLPDVDVNRTDTMGFTALHWACAEDLDIARLLLAAGADPALQDGEGNTSLHIAASYGHIGFTHEMAALSENAMYLENEEGTTAADLLGKPIFCQVGTCSLQ